MTCGIYSLKFASGSTYVGKSNNIELRWQRHKHDFLSNTDTETMMRAYHMNGMPTMTVVAECHEDHLDRVEALYITIIRPNLSYKPIDEFYNYNVLSRNKELLLLSTAQHLEMLENLVSEIADNALTIRELEAKLNKKPWWKFW